MCKCTVVFTYYTDILQGRGDQEYARTGEDRQALDNRHQDNHCQVTDLLGKMEEMVVGSGGSFYSRVEALVGRGGIQGGEGELEEHTVCGPALEEGHIFDPTLEDEGHISGPALEVGAQQAVRNVGQGRPLEERQGERNAGVREAQAERDEPMGPMERAERMERGAGEKEAHRIYPSLPNTHTPSRPASQRQALQQLGETVAQLSEVAVTLRQTYEDQAREEAERHGDAARQLAALRAESAVAASEYSAALTQRDEERDTLQAEWDRLREDCKEKDTDIERLRESCAEKDAEIGRLKGEVADLTSEREKVRRRYEETTREVERNRVILQQFRAQEK